MNTAIKLSDLLGIELESHDREIIASSINFFGSGDHPTALADNLDYFKLDYLLECLDKGIHKARRSYKEEVADIWCAIHMAKQETEDVICQGRDIDRM